MAYYFYLGNVLLPIPPKKLELKISNQNKTYDLMNYSEINVLKTAAGKYREEQKLHFQTTFPW